MIWSLDPSDKVEAPNEGSIVKDSSSYHYWITTWRELCWVVERREEWEDPLASLSSMTLFWWLMALQAKSFGCTSTDTDDVTLPLGHRCSLEGLQTDCSSHFWAGTAILLDYQPTTSWQSREKCHNDWLGQIICQLVLGIDRMYCYLFLLHVLTEVMKFHIEMSCS